MYLHCTSDQNIDEIKRHAKQVGRIELVGRNDAILTNNSTDWNDYSDLDWEWLDWNEGVIYCLREEAATAYGRTCFVLLPIFSEEDTSIHIDHSRYNDEGEILVPVKDFDVAEVMVDGEHHFTPEEWLENSDEYYE